VLNEGSEACERAIRLDVGHSAAAELAEPPDEVDEGAEANRQGRGGRGRSRSVRNVTEYRSAFVGGMLCCHAHRTAPSST
jgi:hypothetical protein